MIHDTVQMEQRGIPSLAVVASEFQHLARMRAQSLYCPSLRIVIVPHPFQTLKESEIVQIADAKFGEIVEALSPQGSVGSKWA